MTARAEPDATSAHSWGPQLALVIGVVSVGVSAILIRWADDIPARSIAFYRLLFATLMLAPFAWAKHRDTFRRLPRKDVLTTLGIGVVLAIHFGTWIESLFHTSVASSVIIVSLESIIAAGAAALFFHEHLSRAAWISIGVAFVGVAVLALGDAAGNTVVPADGRGALFGDLLAFIGAAAAGAYLVAGRRLRQRMDLLVYVVLVYGSCSVCLFLFAWLTDAPLGGFSPKIWGLLLLMALVPTIGGHTLFNWSLRYLRAATVSSAILAEPLIATVLAAVIFHEVPGPLGILGGTIALAGVLVAIRTTQGRRTPQVAATEGSPVILEPNEPALGPRKR